jgi:nitrate/TMAO reductase-like tetraheme cytochrome c subunit
VTPRVRAFLSPIVYFSSNWISLTGVVLVTTAAVFWLFLLPSGFALETHNPYTGILTFIMLPAVFFTGLALIPLGIWLSWRRANRGGTFPKVLPSLDFTNVRLRRLVIFVLVTTCVNIVIAGHTTYTAVEYMDSVTFCGLTCHTVMQPEYTAYQNSPHSRVECVKCHIGPGASWFVKSKISGARQLIAVALKTYERPIPVPVRNLRPSRDTCETCHWPQRFGGERLRVISKYADDETNTKTTSVLMVHIGGGETHRGIHGVHMGPGVVITYAHADEKRNTIPWVRVENSGKQPVEFIADGTKPGAWNQMAQRTMDCMDCHNRPTHTYELPDRGMDRVINENPQIATLPFLKKKGVEILKASYKTRDEAQRAIPAAIDGYYKQSYPAIYGQRAGDIKAASEAVTSVYDRNMFPEMNVNWGTYTNNIGHTDFTGCFRCHDDLHAAGGGKKITQDCSACHELLAMDEANPKVLKDLGMAK